MVEIAEERAELGLYFHLKAIGTGPLAQEFSNVVSNLDRMSFSMSRMRSGIDRVTKTLGVQSPTLNAFMEQLKVGEGLVRTFTGAIHFLSGITEVYGGTLKVLNMILETQFVKAIASAIMGLKGYIATLFVKIGALWGVVKAQLAVLASNPFTWVALGVAIGLIGAMIISLQALEAQTAKTSRSMENLGDISYKRSVFPEMLSWMERIRKEASKPIDVNLRIVESPAVPRRTFKLGRSIGEELAIQLLRKRK